jgi:hypothetical protein
MKLNNIVTFGCSFGVDHRITPASYDSLPVKPSEIFGMVPLRCCAGRNKCLSECGQVAGWKPSKHVHEGGITVEMRVAQHARQSTQATTPNKLVSEAT